MVHSLLLRKELDHISFDLQSKANELKEPLSEVSLLLERPESLEDICQNLDTSNLLSRFGCEGLAED